MNRRYVSRRAALLGLGASTLAVPFLETLTRGAYAQDSTAPLRFVVVMHGQGTMLDRWTPRGTGTGFELSPLLEPLAAHKDKLTVLSGIDNDVRKVLGGNGHNAAGRSLLTCQTFSNAPDGGGDNGNANGPSIDQVIASRIGLDTRFRSLHLDTSCYGPGEYQMLFAGKDDPVSAYQDPQEAFDTVFASLAAEEPTMPAPPTLREQLQARRAGIIEQAHASYGVMRGRVSAEDRRRLELHQEKLAELLKQINRGPSQFQSARCELPSLGVLPQTCEELGDPERTLAQMNIGAMALACDLTRVLTVQFTNYDGPTFPFTDAGIPGDYFNWHAMIHRDGGVLPGRDDMVFAGMSYYSRMVNHLLDQLASFDEGAGTLLDNTVVLWISEFGEGGSHDTESLPVVLAGGLGGRIATGQHLAFGGERTTSDLYVTLLRLFGGTDTEFGYGGSDFNRGPLPGVAV